MPIDITPGLGPVALEPGADTAAKVPFFVECYSTPLLDITQTVSDVELVPAKLGYVPSVRASGVAFWVIESVAGTQTVPPTFQVGQDAAHSNILAPNATSPSNVNVNGANPPSLNGATAGVSPQTTQMIENAPAYFDITSPAAGTGGYKCLARLVIAVVWIAVGG